MSAHSPEHQPYTLSTFTTLFTTIFRDVCLLDPAQAEELADSMAADVVFDAAVQLGVQLEEPSPVEMPAVELALARLFEAPAVPEKVSAQIAASMQALVLAWLLSTHHSLDTDQKTEIMSMVTDALGQLPESSHD